MKKVLCLCAMVMAMAMTAVSARAADITGSWTGTMNTPDGNSMTMGYTFKVDGATLTGTVGSPMGGDPMPFTDGKIDGNNISFKISFNGMSITNTGVINAAGDEIKLTSKSDGGDFPGMEITLKKGAAPAAPAPQL
jgi:hypothetical protein